MPFPKFHLMILTALTLNNGPSLMSHAWVLPAALPTRMSPQRSQTATPTASCLSAKRARGFGTATTATGSKSSTKTKKGGLGGVTATSSKQQSSKTESILTSSHPLVSESKSIQNVLNSRYSDPTVLEDIKMRLRAGQVVILRDAFVPELADAMHAVLSASTENVKDSNWDHNEDYFGDGYHFRHYNIYNPQDFPTLCKDMQSNIFESDATRAFMTELTGRDCNSPEVSAAPSYYGSGDHSLPHTDHIGQRSVAFVWHLSQNWRPEWGGALYWAPEPLANAVHHASYNSLVLFSVTPHSVCTISGCFLVAGYLCVCLCVCRVCLFVSVHFFIFEKSWKIPNRSRDLNSLLVY